MTQVGLRHQALRLALIPTIALASLLAIYFTYTRFQDLEQNFTERSEGIALRLSPACEYAIFTRNKAILQNLAQAALKEYKVKSVAFYTEEGFEIASNGQKSSPFKPPSQPLLNKEQTETTLAITVPIKTYQTTLDMLPVDLSQMDTLVGWLKIEFDRSALHLREYQVLLGSALVLLLGLLLAAVQVWQLDRKITRPIIRLAQAAKRIREGTFTDSICSSPTPELQELALGMNTLAAALQETKFELQLKVDQATASLRRSLETIELQNAELDHARQSAETASQIKSEFLADMSHEIRTPLNAVVGFVNLLEKTELNETQKHYLITLKKSSHILLSIINDILDFSKIESGKLRLEQTITHIRECVEESLNLLAPHANEKSISLIPLFYSDIPEEALGDPLRIKQVVTNLVSNAIKFTEKGSILVRVLVEKAYQRQAQHYALIRISVTDTGLGLSAREQQELRQLFDQGGAETPYPFDDKGLGLIISKKLVEQMKGEIGLESEHGKGSTFWFTFEVELLETSSSKQPTVPTAASYAARSSSAPSTPYIKKPISTVGGPHPFSDSVVSFPSIPFPTSLSSLHILAVDDNLENLQLVATLLQDLGAEVTLASSGQEALKTVMNTPSYFNLILMDIRMPQMSGIEATHAIRNLENQYQLKHTPIIALTAHAFISEREQLLSAGVDDCLTKPVDEKALEKLIQKWVLGSLAQPTHPEPLALHAEKVIPTRRAESRTFLWFQEDAPVTQGSTISKSSKAPADPFKPRKTVIDWELASKLVGGKRELAQELLEKLVKGLPTEQKQMQQAFQAEDWRALRDLVHRLHGACCYCGVPSLKQAAANLEEALETRDRGRIQGLMEKLNQAINDLLTESRFI